MPWGLRAGVTRPYLPRTPNNPPSTRRAGYGWSRWGSFIAHRWIFPVNPSNSRRTAFVVASQWPNGGGAYTLCSWGGRALRIGLGDSFVDVGLALLETRDRRLYKEAGFSAFAAYCRDRCEIYSGGVLPPGRILWLRRKPGAGIGRGGQRRPWAAYFTFERYRAIFFMSSSLTR